MPARMIIGMLVALSISLTAACTQDVNSELAAGADVDTKDTEGCTSSARMGHCGFQVKRQLEPVLIGLV